MRLEVEGVTELDVKRRVRDYCRDWPDSIARERVRECHEALEPGTPFTDFAVLFEEATGYTIGRACRRTSLHYADPVLRTVADELLLLPRMVEGQSVVGSSVGQEGNPDFPRVVDIRYGIASLIFSTVNGSNPSLQRAVTLADLERLTALIAGGIPTSRRWQVVMPIRENADLLARYHMGDFRGFSDTDYRYLNILEDDNIGWIATYGVDEGLQAKAVFNEAFAPFVKDLGLVDFSDYRLPLHMDATFYEDPVTPRVGVVGSWFLKQYAARMGIAPEKLAFTATSIRSLQLADLPTAFIPVFAQILPGEELEDGLFAVDQALIEVNNPARLCLTLPGPRNVILQGIEKGHVFETFIHRFLTGAERVIVLNGGIGQPFPEGFLRGDQAGRGTDRVVTYSYAPPEGGTGFQVRIEGTQGTPLWDLARKAGKPRTELDVLLVHQGEPPHVLVGECKFAWEYKSAYFRTGRKFVERIAGGIRDSDPIRDTLGLPRDLPVVAVLFVSHSGPGVASNRLSLMVPMTHVLSGEFSRIVTHALRHQDEWT